MFVRNHTQVALSHIHSAMNYRALARWQAWLEPGDAAVSIRVTAFARELESEIRQRKRYETVR